MDWLGKLLLPIEWVVAWILAFFHMAFTALGRGSQRLQV